MKQYLGLSCIFAALVLACSSPSEPPAPVHTYTVEWNTTHTDSVLAAINGGPHVCGGLWLVGQCMQCVANKARPDSVCADPPGGWDPPIWTLWGQPIGRQQ